MSVNSQKPRSIMVERLYRSYGLELKGWLRKKFGDGPPDPEDIAQSTFEKFAGLESVGHIENFRSFLFAMASNLAVSAIRSDVRSRRFIETELSTLGIEIEKVTPERVYESKEALILLSNSFQQLTTRQKEIVVRSRVYGETYMEIRDTTGWSLGTISSEMKEAMRSLAEATERGRTSL